MIYLPRVKPTPAYRTQWQIRLESPLERHLQQRVPTVSVATFQNSPLNAVACSQTLTRNSGYVHETLLKVRIYDMIAITTVQL